MSKQSILRLALYVFDLGPDLPAAAGGGGDDPKPQDCDAFKRMQCAGDALVGYQKCAPGCTGDNVDPSKCFECIQAAFGTDFSSCCPCIYYYAQALKAPWMKIDC